MPEPDPNVVALSRAAKLLGISRRQLERLIGAGKVLQVKTPEGRKIDRVSLETLLGRGLDEPEPQPETEPEPEPAEAAVAESGLDDHVLATLRAISATLERIELMLADRGGQNGGAPAEVPGEPDMPEDRTPLHSRW